MTKSCKTCTKIFSEICFHCVRFEYYEQDNYVCSICNKIKTKYVDGLCHNCSNQWDEYFALCKAFTINPTRQGFIAFGGDHEVWDHLS